ncbi:MAG: TlpA disulfide reductase family protein, partial [Chloroflexota bacterium]
MTTPRPGFTHKPPKRGVIGPFSGRQLLVAAGTLVIAAVALVAVTTPLGQTGVGPGPIDPRATPFIISSPPAEGLRPGSTAPELAVTLDDGTTFLLTDLDGQPIRLDALRGKVVWINFWASWCPPCQQETPILRELAERYRDRGLEVVGISVQETSPADVAAYAERYQLDYTIGFDGSGHIFRAYKVFALPTQFFIDTQGVVVQVVNGPVDEPGAAALIESLLP